MKFVGGPAGGEAKNLYGYCGGNPIGRKDPSGQGEHVLDLFSGPPITVWLEENGDTLDTAGGTVDAFNNWLTKNNTTDDGRYAVIGTAKNVPLIYYDSKGVEKQAIIYTRNSEEAGIRAALNNSNRQYLAEQAAKLAAEKAAVAAAAAQEEYSKAQKEAYWAREELEAVQKIVSDEKWIRSRWSGWHVAAASALELPIQDEVRAEHHNADVGGQMAQAGIVAGVTEFFGGIFRVPKVRPRVPAGGGRILYNSAEVFAEAERKAAAVFKAEERALEIARKAEARAAQLAKEAEAMVKVREALTLVSKQKFILDPSSGLSKEVIAGLRARGINVTTVQEALGSGRASDLAIREYARKIGAKVIASDRGRDIGGGFSGVGVNVRQGLTSVDDIIRIIASQLK
jgi:hypothetical protein